MISTSNTFIANVKNLKSVLNTAQLANNTKYIAITNSAPNAKVFKNLLTLPILATSRTSSLL